MKKKYNVVVVGVGAVGEEILRCLRQRNFPIKRLSVFARTPRRIKVDEFRYEVERISEDAFEGVDIALFAGTEGEKGASKLYAKEAIKRKAIVIDNGADFRLDPNVPLVVPEVNLKDISWHRGLISNPNCSTIQMAVAIWPIYRHFGIERIIVSTYQSASGAGRAALQQLWTETEELIKTKGLLKKSSAPKALPKRLAFNLFPHIGRFKNNYTTEEEKMVKETQKIFHDNTLKITATCVRVPVKIGHSEAIYIQTKKRVSIKEVREILSQAKGIKIVDEPSKSLYPMPLDVEGKDEVFIGRIRSDPYNKKGLWLWVVADNLRKGAALNAIQIAEELIK